MSLKSTLKHTVGCVILATERLFRSSKTQTESILILEYLLPLGCCVHLTPLYEAVKQSCPEITLVVSTRGLAAKLLRHHPAIDHLIETPDALVDTLAAGRTLRAELRRRDLHPALILTGASDKRSRIALLALLAAPARRGGYTLVPQIYHYRLDYDFGRSLIDNNLRLAALAGCDSSHREPTVYYSSGDVAVARVLSQIANPHGKPLLILVTQNSGGQSTGWHVERFVEVVRHASEQLGLAIAYVGTPADAVPIDNLRAQTGGLGTSLAGRTSVTELAALLAMSDYLISLDTGTMHLGRAVGVPVVVIGPSWQKPLEWLPLGMPQARILRGADRDDVPPGYRLDEVSAADVLGALRELMAAYPALSEGREMRVAQGLSEVDHFAE